MHSLDYTMKSSVEGIVWPAMPSPAGAAMLALQYQLAQTQWLAPAELHAYQFRQLELVLAHACKTVPYYKEKFRDLRLQDLLPLTMEKWQTIPVLTRAEIQEAETALQSEAPPPEHGKISSVKTSGSTGRPITAYKAEVEQFFWEAFTLRDHLWQRRDLTAKFVAIRSVDKLEPGQGVVSPGWGPSTDVVFKTGPCAVMSISTDIAAQAQWLARQNPVYLLSFPSNILALARYTQEQKIDLPSLREVRAYGEVLDQDVRDACRHIWGVPVKDMYSAKEVGYIALQCPENEHYHVMSESLFVEVVDDDDRPCAPGETGRVLVSTLHNFAMPLIRYALGDYAEVAGQCSCGRTLPVLQRILGRHRNLVVLPDGRRHRPRFTASDWADIAPIKQLQLIQRDLQTITAFVVADRPLRQEEEHNFVLAMQGCFGYPFAIKLVYVEKIERFASGKYEDFYSELTG